MTWNVFYTDSAQRDLQSIYDYIADVLLEPDIANKQTDRLIYAADSLEHMPFRYRLCDYEPWRSKGLRVMPVDNYVVFYMPDESQSTVAIIRIMYGGRDIKNQLGE